MDDRQVARGFGLVRMGFGAGMAFAPARAARLWIGPDADRPATQVALRALGVRDMLLGIGLFRAANGGRSTKAWLAYAAIADGVDAVATLRSWRSLPRLGRLAVFAMAAGATAAGAALSARAD